MLGKIEVFIYPWGIRVDSNKKGVECVGITSHSLELPVQSTQEMLPCEPHWSFWLSDVFLT